MGTVYSAAEISAIADHAHSLGMLVHLDGARISNAAVALDLPLRAFTTDAGVDVVSLGATKNGALGAEAVVALNPDIARLVPFVRKSAMQLSSKMRFTSAQLLAMFEGDLWLRNARHANAMAKMLEREVAGISGVTVSRSAQANGVFAVLPADVTERLQRLFKFYVWDHSTGEVRWMCSWDTTEEDVEAFAAAIRREMSA